MNYSKIFLFLLLSVGLSLGGLIAADFFTDPEFLLAPVVGLLAYSWGPAIAVLLIQRLVYRESLAKYGWNRKHYSFRWILTTLFLPVGVVAGTVAMVFFLGNMLHLPGFGKVIFGDPSFAREVMSWLSPFTGDLFFHIYMPQELWVLFLLVLLFGILAGGTFNLLFNVGEEVGWRGLMLVETKQMGFLGSNLIIGGLWGLWSAPFFLYYYPEPTSDLLWFLFANVGYCVAISFPMAYFAFKARSIYASATFTGVMNNLAILSTFFVLGGDPLLGSVKGLAGMFVFLMITYLIIRYDEDFVNRYSELFY